MAAFRKRILSFLLAAMLLIGLFSASAFAEDEAPAEEPAASGTTAEPAGDEPGASPSEGEGTDPESSPAESGEPVPAAETIVDSNGNGVDDRYDVFTVVYDLAGGETESGRTTFTGLRVGDSVPSIAKPVREDYIFQGWAPAVASSVSASAAASSADRLTIRYTAVWSSVYCIELDGDSWKQGGDASKKENADTWYWLFKDFEPTGNWAEDLVTIARTQEGYIASYSNYLINRSGEIRHYTRYGEWYGLPYSDWCAMFVCFCLHYAQVPRTALGIEAGCGKWVKELKEEEKFAEPEGYRPKAGDLLFLDFAVPGTEYRDGWADHIAIVIKVNRTSVTAIEGGMGDRVRIKEYERDDPDILGYGVMPENPDYVEPGETQSAAERLKHLFS